MKQWPVKGKFMDFVCKRLFALYRKDRQWVLWCVEMFEDIVCYVPYINQINVFF